MAIQGTGEGEYLIHVIFDMPNTEFSIVLVLVMRFTSARLNMICTNNIFE